MLNRYIPDIYVPLQLGSSDALGNCFRQLVIPCPVTLSCSYARRHLYRAGTTSEEGQVISSPAIYDKIGHDASFIRERWF